MTHNRANSTSLRPVQRSLKAEDHTGRERLWTLQLEDHTVKKNMKAFIHILSSIDAVCSDLCCGDDQGEGKRSCSRWSVSPTHFLPRLRGLEKTLHSDCQSYLTAAAFRRCKESCNFTDWTSDPVDSWLIGCWLPLSFLRTKGGIITN